jgi:hypothetical protein
MNNRLSTVTLCLVIGVTSSACAKDEQELQPSIDTAEFPGFVINGRSDYQDITLDGYEYALSDSGTVSFNKCPQVDKYDENRIAEYDFYRFRLLRISCVALKKYFSAQSYQKIYFPKELSIELVNKLPAASIPQLNRSQKSQLAGKTIKSQYPDAVMSRQEARTVKVVTDEDEYYYSLMAIGDFTNDGIGDLLVRSEWYVRNASGKHVDLLVLSKTGNENTIDIAWHINGAENITGSWK